MKIVAVLGSPKLNGNSAILARRFLDAAQRLGAETQSFTLNELAYQGCQACRACKKTSEVCVLKDDLSGVLNAIQGADVIVFASPVYFGDIAGQMKLLIDRTYSFLTPNFHSDPKTSRLASGKTCVLILTQGLAEAMFADVFSRYEWVMKLLGMETVHLIRACNVVKPGDVSAREDTLKQADALATRIMDENTAHKSSTRE
ncbi:MAG TPA: flavodoxin family protein [Candidatus Hydrogenedentes bacterium]|nr:flavodoxin family protein [Candidatus Hydrogenedentota bacterium]